MIFKKEYSNKGDGNGQAEQGFDDNIWREVWQRCSIYVMTMNTII